MRSPWRRQLEMMSYFFSSVGGLPHGVRRLMLAAATSCSTLARTAWVPAYAG